MKRFLIFFLLLTGQGLYGQQKNVFPDRIHRRNIEAIHGATNDTLHLGVQPYLESHVDLTKVPGYAQDSTPYYLILTEKLFSDHLIKVEGEDFRFTADLLLNLSAGWSLDGKRETNKIWDFRDNTRGILIQGDITDKFSLVTGFYENQSIFPAYIDSMVFATNSVPGLGRVKYEEAIRDYSMSFGYISVTPAKWINIQAGHDQQFIGHGHRSLLTSNNSFNYPFARVNLSLFQKKLFYRINYSGLQSLVRQPSGETPESLFKRKGLSSMYLSYKPNKKFEIGLFEQTIWRRYDDSTGTLPFDPAFLNPVIGLNSGAFGLEGNDNVLVGLNLAVWPVKSLKIYGQGILDGNNKNGWQAGAQVIGIKKQFDIRIETNQVSSYTYHTKNVLQSHTHNNQFIAHPLGAGFKEYLSQVHWYRNRLFANIQVLKAELSQQLKPDGTWDYNGRRPTAPEPADPLQSEKENADLFRTDLTFGYIFNFKTNLQVNAGFTYRELLSVADNQYDRYFWIGLRTNLLDQYFDF